MIRLATKDDEQTLFDICIKFFKETNHNDLTVSRQKVITLIRSFTEGDINDKIFLVAEDQLGTIYGALAGFTTGHIFAEERMAYELLWYVDPLYRNRKDTILIIKAYEAWAKKVGCHYCAMGDSHRGTALERYYKKNNYKLIETVYNKRIT